jgi:hypothetical protein
MNEAHRGKIGHLPKAVQEQVNRRRESGEKGRTLVAWLKALPEAQATRPENCQQFRATPVAFCRR